MKWFAELVVVAALLVLAACGGDSDPSTEADAPTATSEAADSGDSQGAADVEEAAVEDAVEFAEELTESITEKQAAEGGGGAVLVVGETEWTFDSVLCAFGEEEIGQAGAEFVLSSIKDGLQLYVSVDEFGHSVSLDDVQDFDNPSVALNAGGDGLVVVTGKDISAEGAFADFTSEDMLSTPGALTATCP
jgi:hypothetical protein